jgi:hypothetical protein
VRAPIEPEALRRAAQRYDALKVGFKLAGHAPGQVTLIHLALHLNRAADLLERLELELDHDPAN